MSEFPRQSLLEKTIDFLESRHVDYMIMGGIAVRFWGIPRPTFDLVFTLALAPGLGVSGEFERMLANAPA